MGAEVGGHVVSRHIRYVHGHSIDFYRGAVPLEWLLLRSTGPASPPQKSG